MSAAGRPSAVTHLRRPATIRERCANILTTGLGGGLTHFRVEPSRLPQVADFVAAVARRRYPGLAIPYHSRWRHLDAGGVARVAALGAALSRLPAAERARAKIDLIVTSVLLDAGAGETWRFREAQTGQTFARSEGLAVASFRSPAAAVGLHKVNAALRPSTCPAANKDGCYQVTFRVAVVDDAAKRAAARG